MEDGTLPGLCFLEEDVMRSVTFFSATDDWVALLDGLLVLGLTQSPAAFFAAPFFRVCIVIMTYTSKQLTHAREEHRTTSFLDNFQLK
jgi:hypothetical protein